MDFLKFINSDSIRNHLKEINYEFSPIEASVVAWQGDYCTIDERHAAWQYIIDNTPDEKIIDSIDERYKFYLQIYKNSMGLHECLQFYIDTEKRLIDLAKKDEAKTVFTFEIYYQWDFCRDEIIRLEDKTEYTSFDELMKAVDNKIEYMQKQNYRIKWIFTKKRWTEAKGIDEMYIELQWNPDKSLFNLVDDTGVRNDQEFYLYSLFEHLQIKIPTPFQKGDILYANDEGRTRNKFKKNPFVLEKLCYWDDTKCSTYSLYPQSATGYFIEQENQVLWEDMPCYLNLTYYDEKPVGIYRILKAMSSYMQQEIDMGEMMAAYSIILDEERAKLQKNGWSDRTLEFAGLKEEN